MVASPRWFFREEMRPCPVWILHLIFLSMKTASTVSSGRLISHQSLPNYLSGQISSWLCLHRLHQTQRMHKAQQSPPSMKQTKHVPQLPGPKGLHCSHPHFLPTCSYSQPNNAVLSHSCLAFEVLTYISGSWGGGYFNNFVFSQIIS